MAKLRDTPINAADLREYLDTQDDFALELHAYRMARTHGFSVSHGGTYEDPVTKKIRQYDVRASFARPAKHIDLTIECKSLKRSYPLLVSRIGRSGAESFHEFIYSFEPRANMRYGYIAAPAKAVRVDGPASLYPPGAFVGKSLSQVGRTSEKGDLTSGDAEVYDKWYQALASAHNVVQEAVHAKSSNPAGCQATVVLPVLVVSDETLWVADHEDDGTPLGDPRQADDALLYVGREYWRPMSVEFVASHLHICTKTGLNELLSLIATSDSFWESAFPREAIQRALRNT